ncbi:MAG TPA: glycosyltransferase [Verrucomicrobiae bacterium]|nr:glycosyltransferase [Verrucomicrobiae bacterium]
MSYAPIRTEPTTDTDTLTTTPLSKSNSDPSKPRRSNRRKAASNSAALSAALEFPLIVHCHLCWDWVWQRPQQFMSRMSQRHPVLFVEMRAPDASLATPVARFHSPPGLPNLIVLSLQFPGWRWQDADYVDRERRRLVREFLAGPGAGRFENAVQWFYDPMAFPAFSGQMGEVLTVYDCMDELSRFTGAPPQLVQRERGLLAAADVVFTGGRKLFEAKSQFHPNCHFYGCGVDGEHFGRARLEDTPVPEDIAALPRPILGYFGVVDERMDYALLERQADAHAPGSVVVVGPVLKVSADALPHRPNLHWVGQRPYADLPAVCKGFDVCLMPFALNEATEYINPTKALEYMATGKLIVSTAVPDVVRNFGAVIKIARNHRQFISHCARCLDQPDYEAIARGLKMAAENSWDSIVARLEQHLREALEHKAAKERSNLRRLVTCTSAESVA